MSPRRLAGPAALLGVLLVGLWWTRDPPSVAGAPPEQAPAPSVHRSAPRPSTEPGGTSAEALPTVFADRADRVRTSCDLALDTRCDDQACAGVLAAPDLDRLDGWLELVFRSPRFVLSTAARDLGVPPDALPCGAAVEALVREGGVTAVELPDGTEVWCTVTGSVDAGRALCDALTADLRGADDPGFRAEGLRRLEFSGPR